MAFSTLTNLVRVATATTGTGTMTLGSAVTGFLSVPGGLDGKSVTYEIADPGTAPTAREIGRGVYTASGGTLTRVTVFSSTNGGSAINLSGNAYVSLPICADDIANINPTSITVGTAAAASQGEVMLAAGTTTTHPIAFTAGSNLTNAQNGAMEYDGNALMFTPSATSRGAIPAVQFISLTASYTLSNTTALQKVFNNPANGSLTVTASTRYMFESLLYVGSMAAAANASFDLKGAGNASLTSALWCAIGLDATTPTTAAALGGCITAASGSSSNIVTSANGSAMFALIKGQFRVNAGGTIIPSIGLTTAVGTAAVQTDSYFACWPASAGTVTSLGNWT